MKKEQVFKTLRAYSMVIVLIVIALLFHFLTDGLIFTPMNLTNLILQNSYVVILILGMLPIILTGSIDLSVGSVLAFVGAIAAIMQVNLNIGFLPTLLVSLIAGILIGAWQGFWVAYFDIPAFIVTLSGELVFRGLAQVVLDGASIGPFSNTFRAMAASFLPDLFGGTNLHITTIVLAVIACATFTFSQFKARKDKAAHGVPVKSAGGMIVRIVLICLAILFLSYEMATYQGYPTVLIIMLVLSLIYSFICNRTVFGRSLYAIGGNRKAAALSGIKDRKYLFLAFVNMGLMSAVAALIYAARLNAATPKAGINFELDAIAACFVGGASVTGGAGTIVGALIGCFVIGILNNGMSMLGVSADWQQTVKGLVILFAVVFDLLPKRRKK
ncbi:MAG: multiple monosaccharide ABC transporter permease [Oscillospiraceae bacterium]|nr:multiple monosaccharide ABC transporter permease [Oscillospiraceae bacterium]